MAAEIRVAAVVPTEVRVAAAEVRVAEVPAEVRVAAEVPVAVAAAEARVVKFLAAVATEVRAAEVPAAMAMVAAWMSTRSSTATPIGMMSEAGGSTRKRCEKLAWKKSVSCRRNVYGMSYLGVEPTDIGSCQ